jgi:hypothetical protein
MSETTDSLRIASNAQLLLELQAGSVFKLRIVAPIQTITTGPLDAQDLLLPLVEQQL